MSLPSTAMFYTRDILKEYNLRPWWEKLRSFAYSGCVVFTLLILWLNFEWDTMQCLPNQPVNTTAPIVFSVQLSRMVNLYCYREISFYIQYSGVFVTVATILLFVSSNVLVVCPGFIAAVKTYKKTEPLHQEEGGTAKASEPLYQEEGGTAKASKDLPDDTPTSKCMHTLGVKYLVRNIFFLVASIAVGSYHTFLVFHVHGDAGFLECRLNEAYQTGVGYSLGGVTTFFCSYYVTHRLLPATIAYTALVWLQCLATLLGTVWMARCCCEPVNKDPKYFLKELYTNSEPSYSDMKREEKEKKGKDPEKKRKDPQGT